MGKVDAPEQETDVARETGYAAANCSSTANTTR
jgi:hypothetical protein